MNKLVKYLILSVPFIYVGNSYSQNTDTSELERIENMCHDKNEADLEKIQSFGFQSITSEKLLAQCIKNATEISEFNSSNTPVNTEELYNQTITILNGKINELSYSQDYKLKRQHACFKRQHLALLLARNSVLVKNTDEGFLRRALITTNNLLNNNCKSLIN